MLNDLLILGIPRKLVQLMWPWLDPRQP
jgi:hypothetical protein